ncbi:hypothetical protein [Coleofasciculus sp. G1-WW12-02]|uniref:hypothetical protein n=1 Tax=Coleofasciculus sp. G1-WW12-02 TaxID=3068483 RepID=UPI0040638C43
MKGAISMVSENRQNRQCLGVPTDWNVPKFSLGQRIRAKHAFLNTIRIQTGLITGIECFSPDSYWVTQHNLKPGWRYSIQVDRDDPWYTTSPVLFIHESAISALTKTPTGWQGFRL